MLALLLLACSSQAVPGQDGAAGESVDEILKGLVEKTNGLRAFVAEYRIHKAGEQEDLKIRLVYEAPARALMKMDLGRQSLVVRLQDGEFETRMPGARGGSAYGRVDWSGMNERLRALRAAMRAEELPILSKDWSEADASRPSFGFRIEEGQFHFHLVHRFEGGTILGWLKWLQRKETGRLDGAERLEFVEPDGTRLFLSRNSGFIERIEKPKEEGLSFIQLEVLDLEPRFDSSTFELPSPLPGAEDISESLTSKMHSSTSMMMRSMVFKRVASAIEDEKLEWDDAIRDKLKTVLAALHAGGAAGQMKGWTADFHKNIDGFVRWLEKGVMKGLEQDFDQMAKEWKAKMLESIEGAEQRYRDDFKLSPEDLEDVEFCESFLAVEGAAIDEAFARGVADPLTQYFEEAVKAVLH